VTDPEGMSSQITKKVVIKSILSLDFAAYPRVTQRETPINFQADSPEASVFAWNFGDGNIKSGRNSNITHVYKESGIYTVKLEVSDSDDKINTYFKKVYI
jgi:PKD repeat protein